MSTPEHEENLRLLELIRLEPAWALSRVKMAAAPTSLEVAEMERRLLTAMDEDEAMSALQLLRPWLRTGTTAESFKVLICGSRGWSDSYTIYDRVQQLPRGTIVIEGGAQGADELARDAAVERGLFVAQVPCKDEHWKRHGKGAGHQRNAAMLALDPDLVIAFHLNNSPGTRGTVARARELGIPVEVYEK